MPFLVTKPLCDGTCALVRMSTASRISFANMLNVPIRKNRRVVLDARCCDSRQTFSNDASPQGLLVMKNLLWFFCLAIVSSSAADAQDALIPIPRSDDSFLGAVPDRQPEADPESGYQRYETPRELIFRRAALKAARRQERMAINARFGYSPSRPPSSTLPFMGSPIAPPTAFRVFTPYPGSAFPRPYARF